MPEARGLYEVSREKMRTRHFAYRTEQAYLYWIRRYVNFHRRKHPREMGSSEVEAFLTHLAVDEHVSASTQNQALQALLFLYRQVLEIDLPWLENVTRARRSKRLPVALARKFPNASRQWGWQYVFPARSLCRDVYTGEAVHHHMHEKAMQRAVQMAIQKAGITCERP